MRNQLNMYKKNHLDREYTMIGLFIAVKNEYNPRRVLYPGSYIHITPSLVFPDVTYVDSFRNTNKFFESQEIKEYIGKNKQYAEESKFYFYLQDYYKEMPEEMESFDLLISQYGGFVGQATKKYLRKGGFLICNNSHGDATLASMDSDYELVAVYNRRSDTQYSISSKRLDEYLIPKKNIKIDKSEVEKAMKGIAYKKSPSGYVFKKIISTM